MFWNLVAQFRKLTDTVVNSHDLVSLPSFGRTYCTFEYAIRITVIFPRKHPSCNIDIERRAVAFFFMKPSGHLLAHLVPSSGPRAEDGS